jgi:hypothetical protein
VLHSVVVICILEPNGSNFTAGGPTRKSPDQNYQLPLVL